MEARSKVDWAQVKKKKESIKEHGSLVVSQGETRLGRLGWLGREQKDIKDGSKHE